MSAIVTTTTPSIPHARNFVVIGDTHLARSVCASLGAEGHAVGHLFQPRDEELRAAVARQPNGLAVLLHDDVASLRYALAVAHLSPTVPLVVTIFDRTVADELRRLLPQCDVTSPADLVAPVLAGPCLDPSLLSLRQQGRGALAVRRQHGRLLLRPWTSVRPSGWAARAARFSSQLRPHDDGTRLLVFGMLAMAAVLLGDWSWMVAHGRPPTLALFEAARVLAGVGPATAAPGERGYQVAAAVAMLCTIAFSALFTAGVVERMLSPRLIGLVGRRTLPRSGHVIVVGMGQVGIRLCLELRRLGIPVVGVERDPNTATARLARSLGIPVMVGHGGDRSVLERLRLGRARALAAVGSDDLDNIAVAIAAHGVAPGTRVVIRAGEHEAIAETRSLLPMGAIRDVTQLAGVYVLARLRGQDVAAVAADDHELYVQSSAGDFGAATITDREQCRHLPAPASAPVPVQCGCACAAVAAEGSAA